MGFERLFTLSAFEALRFIRLQKLESPQADLPACVEIIRSREAGTSTLDFEAGVFLHAMVAEAPPDSAHFYQACVSSLLLSMTPNWVRTVPLGRQKFMSSLAGEPYRDIRSVFREAGLLNNPPSWEEIEWWDRLSNHVRSGAAEQRNEQSREAERLSLDRERAHVQRLGIDREPVWVAVENNTAGFDILSFRRSGEAVVNHLVEVKSTVASPLRFVLSSGEWRQAEDAGPAYEFHLWDMSKAPRQLHVRTVEEVRPHIPQDQAKGRWKDCFIPVS